MNTRRFFGGLRAIGLLAGVMLPLIVANPASASTLVATYQFNNTLNADQGGAPAIGAVDPSSLSGFVSDTVFGNPRTVYHFAGSSTEAVDQGGLSLDTTSLLGPGNYNNYSVEIIFKFITDNSGYRRILEVQGRQSDNGLYANGAGLELYADTGTQGSTFTNDSYHQVVLTNDSDNPVRLYIDGALVYTVNPSSSPMDIDNANNPNFLLNFFLDNSAGSFTNEYANGDVALIQLYSGVLTDEDVRNLYDTPFPADTEVTTPEPGTIALALLGSLGLGGYAWRRKKAVLC